MATYEYDIVIIGSGPNGLEIAAYLAKARQKVLLLEKRYEAGGGLATEQITLPEFFHNTHAIFHMMVDYAPIYQDLDMEGTYGVRHILPDLQWCFPTPDDLASFEVNQGGATFFTGVADEEVLLGSELQGAAPIRKGRAPAALG